MKRLSFILPACLFALVFFARPAWALSISPAEKEYNVNPGDVVEEAIQIINESNVPTTVYPIKENFRGQGEGGGADFYPASDDPYGLAMAKWINYEDGAAEDKAITLQPGERTNLRFKVNVPTDASPGGHYGSIILSSVSPVDRASGKSSIALNRDLAFMMFYRVSGDIREAGGITQFGFVKPKPWYNRLPVDFFLRFENSGNVHLRPVGNLFIRNWLNKQAAVIDVNTDGRAVLPNSIRRFEFSWSKDMGFADNASELLKEFKQFGFGKYTATLVLTYGYDYKTVTQEVVFFVWPWHLLLVFGGGFIVLLLVLWLLVKLYNRMLIKAYKKQMEKESKKQAA